MSGERERLAEYREMWLWHEATDELCEGYGAHMGQMLYRLPRDGQTRDMKQSIENMIGDLQSALDLLAEKDAEIQRLGPVKEWHLSGETEMLTAERDAALAERDALREDLARLEGALASSLDEVMTLHGKVAAVEALCDQWDENGPRHWNASTILRTALATGGEL